MDPSYYLVLLIVVIAALVFYLRKDSSIRDDTRDLARDLAVARMASIRRRRRMRRGGDGGDSDDDHGVEIVKKIKKELSEEEKIGRRKQVMESVIVKKIVPDETKQEKMASNELRMQDVFTFHLMRQEELRKKNHKYWNAAITNNPIVYIFSSVHACFRFLPSKIGIGVVGGMRVANENSRADTHEMDIFSCDTSNPNNMYTTKSTNDILQPNDNEYEYSTRLTCPICLDQYTPGDEICWSSNTTCSHDFHLDCMIDWLMMISADKQLEQEEEVNNNDSGDTNLSKCRNDCPLCRIDYIPVDINEGDSPV